MGTEYYRDGKTIKYIGNFVNGKYEGKGKYYDKSGEMYDGSWKKGLKHGKGYECDKNGIIIKECYYKKGKLKKNDKRSKTE